MEEKKKKMTELGVSTAGTSKELDDILQIYSKQPILCRKLKEKTDQLNNKQLHHDVLIQDYLLKAFLTNILRSNLLTICLRILPALRKRLLHHTTKTN